MFATAQRRSPLALIITTSLFVLPACSGGGSSGAQIPAVSNDTSSSNSSQSVQQPAAADKSTAVLPAIGGKPTVVQPAVGGKPTVQADATAGQGTRPSRTTDVALSYVNEVPATADAFVNSIGADTKFNYSGSPYDLNWNAISAALVRSGMKHVRENGNVNMPSYMARLAFLTSNGIKHSAQALIGPNGTPAKITSDLVAYDPSTVDFIEPQNEYDGNAKQDPNWAANIKALQQVMYTTIRGNAAFSKIKVLGPALVNAADHAQLGPIDNIEDEGNLHYATCDFNPGTSGLASVTKLLRSSTVNKPISTTEDGYTDDMSRPCSLTDSAIAIYAPRTIAERWNIGEPRSYFFEFADMPTDVVFGKMGLVRSDGTPKPQYTTIQSMISLLADPGGSSSAPKPLAYTMTLNTPSIHHTLLQKQNGTYYLLLWQEVSSWDHKNRTAITVASQNVIVNLQQLPKHVEVYRYNSAGTLSKRGMPSTKTLHVPVGDTIAFLEIQ